jgi:hypothetical protein
MNTLAFADRASYLNLRTSPGLKQRHQLWYQIAVAMAVVFVLCAGMAIVDDRTLLGVSVWNKPAKFSASIAVYFATLAWFAPLLPLHYFRSRRGRALAWIPVVCAVLEMLYIVVQAARGEMSHFNRSTPFNAMMYSLMGGGAVLMVVATLAMGLEILRTHRLSNPFALAVALGLIGTFVLGGGFGGFLGSSASGHWVGGSATDANGLVGFNWSRDGGDLRVAHFFGMHAMQALPLAAALLPEKLATSTANSMIAVFFGLYAALSTWTFIQAIHGQPFLG